MNRKELMEKMGLKDVKHFMQHYLQPTLSAGLVEMTLPDKPKSKKQCYRLTAKGNLIISSVSTKNSNSWRNM